MNKMVRKVLARYFEEPGEFSPDMDKSWMEYLEDKSKPYADPDSPVIDMLKNKRHTDPSFNMTNPYDYENPSDVPKDQKDSPPFENVINTPTQVGLFNRPDSYSPGGILEDWWKVRQEDYTQDEDQQQPALSLTRKLASGVVPWELLAGFSVPESEFFNFVLRSKVAASFNEIISKDFHYKNDLKMDRATKCKADWVNQSNAQQVERGLFVFRVTSPGSKYGSHSVYLQFLKDENKPVDKYIDCPVHIGCTCPSFLFSGAQYYAVKDGYMYMPAFKPDLLAPQAQNTFTMSISPRYPNGKKNPGRGLNSRVCKHILAVFEKIKDTPIEVHYRKYPIVSPPSKEVNTTVWEEHMKFPFTEKDVRDRLMANKPKVPAYFRSESMTPAVIDWFYNVWFPRSDEEKFKSLREFAMYPERIFFILIEEAYLKRAKNDHISPRLIDEGFALMDKVIQKDNPAEPQIIPEYAKKQKTEKKKKEYGVPSTPVKVKHPENLRKPSTVKSVKPAIQ
jgi:hypothetical protein